MYIHLLNRKNKNRKTRKFPTDYCITRAQIFFNRIILLVLTSIIHVDVSANKPISYSPHLAVTEVVLI